MENYITNVKKIAEEYNLKLNNQRKKARKYLSDIAKETLNDVEHISSEGSSEDLEAFKNFLRNIIDIGNDIVPLYKEYLHTYCEKYCEKFDRFDRIFTQVVDTIWFLYDSIEVF